MPRLNAKIILQEEMVEERQNIIDISTVSLETIQKNFKRVMPVLDKKAALSQALEDNKLDIESVLPALADIVHGGSQENNRVKCLELALKMNGALEKDSDTMQPVQIIVHDGTVNIANMLTPRKPVQSSPVLQINSREKDE